MQIILYFSYNLWITYIKIISEIGYVVGNPIFKLFNQIIYLAWTVSLLFFISFWLHPAYNVVLKLLIPGCCDCSSSNLSHLIDHCFLTTSEITSFLYICKICFLHGFGYHCPISCHFYTVSHTLILLFVWLLALQM